MNIDVNEHGIIELRQVFCGISFVTSDGEELHVCMRDSGFEITYQGEWYALQQGQIKNMKSFAKDEYGITETGCLNETDKSNRGSR